MPGTLPAAERITQDISVQPEIIEPTIVNEGGTLPVGPVIGIEEVNRETEQVFSRAHSDGQEFSGTLEQARKVCPALGRMSVENARATLQEEDLAARVAQRGREKRQAEAAKANEGTVHSDKPANAEKDGTKLEAKQIEHDDGRIIAETTSADVQYKQVLEAVHTQQPTPAAVHDLFIRQTEAVRLSQATNEIRDETGKIVESEGIKVVGLAIAAGSSYSDTLVDEGFEMAKPIEEIVRRTAAPVDEVTTESRTHEEVARLVFIEEISRFDVAQPDAPEQLSPEYFVDVEQAEISISLDEPFNETAEGQAGIETAPVEKQEILADYELLEEDEVILLMADFERNKAEIDEAEDFEIITADPTDNEVTRLTSPESQSVVSVPELPAPIEEIETAITQLAEVLDLAETNETQKVYQILEEIITLPNDLEASTGEAEKGVEQKLEELFVRLFEQMGTEYTPELVGSFVKLTQAHYLKELLPIAIETDDDTQTLPDEIGTREFLQKLQHGLSAMKQAAIHFYEIGRSVMRLYTTGWNVPQFITI